MISTKIIIQSLEDVANGMELMEGIPKESVSTAKDFSVAILESGMVSGKTSLMFILKDGNKAKIAEMSAAQFEMLVGAVKGAVERFKG
jgi:hypothetical protein